MATAELPQQRFNMRYLPVKGCHLSQNDVDILGPWLAEHNGFTYAELLEAASARGSVAHDYLEWSDAAAAQAHRLDQVRQITRSVDVAYEVKLASGKIKEHRHRAFHPVVMEIVKDPDNGELYEQVAATIRPRATTDTSYSRVISTFAVLGDGASRAQVLRRFEMDLDALTRRWARYCDVDKTLRGQIGDRLQRAARRFLGD